MKPSFLVDQNLSPKTVAFLKELGFEATRVSEVGLQSSWDAKVADYAKTNKLVIITLDKDFGEIYHLSGKTVGVVVLRLDKPTVDSVNALLKSFLAAIEPSRLNNAFVILSKENYRIFE